MRTLLLIATFLMALVYNTIPTENENIEVEESTSIVIETITSTPNSCEEITKESTTEEYTTEKVAVIDSTPMIETSNVETPGLNSLGTYKITSYCACEKCCGKWAINRPLDEEGNTIVYTASGAIAQGNRTVAVDTSIIPYGTVLIIDGREYIAQDTGSAVKGNIIDIYFESHDEALAYGSQYKEVFVY